MSYLSFETVYEVFAGLYKAHGSRRKMMHINHLIDQYDMSEKTARLYLSTGEGLQHIDKHNANEFKHSETFIRLVKLNDESDAIKRAMLGGHEMYRNLIMRFGNVVPTETQLARFLRNSGYAENTIERMSSPILATLNHFKFNGVLKYDVEQMRGPDKPRPDRTPRGKRDKTVESVEDALKRELPPKKRRRRYRTREEIDYDLYPLEVRKEFDFLRKRLRELHAEKQKVQTNIAKWEGVEARIDNEIRDARESEAELIHKYREYQVIEVELTDDDDALIE